MLLLIGIFLRIHDIMGFPADERASFLRLS